MAKEFTIPLNRAEYTKYCGLLYSEHGINITNDHGSIEQDVKLLGISGTIKLGYSFIEGDGLTITIQSKPMLVTSGRIESEVRKWFAES